MSKTKEEGCVPVDFFEIPEGLLPTLPWFPRTDAMAERTEDYLGYRNFADGREKETEG